MQMKSGGAYAFQNPKLAAALGMTPEQLKKLQEKNLAANRELALEYQRLRKESQERILGEVLTKDQQKKIEALTGEKFELQPVQRGNFNVLPNGKKTSTNK
jgi:cobalamin biosynthesis protein CobT